MTTSDFMPEVSALVLSVVWLVGWLVLAGMVAVGAAVLLDWVTRRARYHWAVLKLWWRYLRM